MKFPSLKGVLGAIAWSVAVAGAQAADFVLTGDITYNTDVVRIGFAVAPGGAVTVWTDSWKSGLNFDPVVAVWMSGGSGYTLLGEVDDDDTVGAGQGAFDAGLRFASLAGGQYLLTVAASPNYANGQVLAAGFGFDGSTPIRIADWNQPGYDPNANDQKGTAWSVHLSGVTQAALVPEPSTGLLMALGLSGLGVVAARRWSSGAT